MTHNDAVYAGIFKLAAVGCYTFAASSLAILVQMLSAGSVPLAAARDIGSLAFTVFPLFVCGLVFDFFQTEQLRFRPIAWFAFVLAAALIGFSASTLEQIFTAYLPQAGRGFFSGTIFGFAIFGAAAVFYWVISSRK